MNIINKSNKKGFTLVELLVVIVILGIITALSIPLIRNISESGTEKKYTAYSQALIDSAKLYVNSYSKDLFGNNTTGCAYVKYSDLSDKKLTKDIQIENTSCNTNSTFVRVVKLGDKYSYVAQLGCGTVKNNKVNKVELRPNPGIVINTQCSTDPDTRVSIEPTIPNETSLTKKSVTLQLKLTSLTGFQNNALKLKYTWTTSMDSVDSDAVWKDIDFPTTPSATEQKKQILANKEITLKNTTKTKLITPSGKTEKYYLAVKPEVINDVSGNDILLKDKNKVIYFGPYIIDNSAPTIPDIKLYQWKTNNESSRPTNKTTGLSSYTAGSWSNKKIIAVPIATDTISGTDLTYKYTTTGKTKNENDVIYNYRNIEAEGESTIKYKACDKAGNCSAYSEAKSVKIDTIFPTISSITITSTNSKYNALTATAKISAYDNLKENELQMCVSTSGYCSTWTTYKEEHSITFSGTLDGKNRTLYVSIKDAAGNITKKTKSYTVYGECGSSSVVSDGNWVNDGSCSKACGSGEQKQTSGTKDKITGKVCSKTEQRKIACNTQGCCSSTYDSYTDFSSWTTCTKKCGTGTRTRSRTITKISNYDGSNCGTRQDTQTENCNTQACCSSTYDSYGDYGSWSSCTKKCGTGTRSRSRTITKISNYDGSSCGTRQDTQSENCNTQTCCSSTYTQYGNYWGWSTCTASCGGGWQTNSRTATSYSSYDNSVCSTWTDSSWGQACNTQSCCTISWWNGTYCYKYFGASCYSGQDGCSNTWVCKGNDTNCAAATNSNCKKMGGTYYYYKRC